MSFRPYLDHDLDSIQAAALFFVNARVSRAQGRSFVVSGKAGGGVLFPCPGGRAEGGRPPSSKMAHAAAQLARLRAGSELLKIGFVHPTV